MCVCVCVWGGGGCGYVWEGGGDNIVGQQVEFQSEVTLYPQVETGWGKLTLMGTHHYWACTHAIVE